jgi:hypothetical protein
MCVVYTLALGVIKIPPLRGGKQLVNENKAFNEWNNLSILPCL